MDRSCAALALVGLLAAAQAAPAATEPLRAHAPTASAGDLETAVAHARAEAVEELHELARWCRGRKLYGTRHEVLETVLVLAPDDETAREELGWRRDADGAWTRPKVPRRPRDHSKTAQREFERERAAIVDALRAKLVAAARAADVGPAELRELLDDVLALAPDDPNTRWLLGEQRRGDEWVLVDTLRAEERRADLERAVASVFARGVEETAAEPTETMEALGLDWTATVGTPHGTVTGTVPADELDRTAELLAVTHRVLVRDVLSKQASFGDGCTVFALRPEDKDAFVDGYPGLDANYRDFLRTLLGSGIQGTPDLALWGPDEADRRDMLVRAALPWLFADAYGVATAKGWIYEGFGLYLSDLIVGTRLHWFAQPEQGRSTAQDADSVGERMNDPDADWHAEAHAVLVGESPPSLPFLLGKDVNTLTAREILVSHALAAYLIECRPEVLPGVWAGIGAGESGPVVLERALDTTFEHLRPTLTRWLAERSGVEEDSDDAAPREPAPRPEPSRPASSRDDDEIELRWDGEAIALSELPEELGDAPRHAVRAWADWCLERHYALELRADGRVLLALPTSARRPERARELTA